jgi:hypothetical protein
MRRITEHERAEAMLALELLGENRRQKRHEAKTEFDVGTQRQIEGFANQNPQKGFNLWYNLMGAWGILMVVVLLFSIIWGAVKTNGAGNEDYNALKDPLAYGGFIFFIGSIILMIISVKVISRFGSSYRINPRNEVVSEGIIYSVRQIVAIVGVSAVYMIWVIVPTLDRFIKVKLKVLGNQPIPEKGNRVLVGYDNFSPKRGVIKSLG